MRGVYTIYREIASLSTAKTVLLGTAPVGTLIELLEAFLTNANQNSVEQLFVGLYPVLVIGSPAGSTITPIATESGSGNSAVTWLGDLTTEPSTYDTARPYHAEGVTNVIGYRYEPPPEGRRLIPSAGSFGMKLMAAPGNPFKAECMITYREIK